MMGLRWRHGGMGAEYWKAGDVARRIHAFSRATYVVVWDPTPEGVTRDTPCPLRPSVLNAAEKPSRTYRTSIAPIYNTHALVQGEKKHLRPNKEASRPPSSLLEVILS